MKKENTFSCVLRAFDELKGVRLAWFTQLGRLGFAVFTKAEEDVSSNLESQLLREKAELEGRFVVAKDELGQCLKDLRSLAVTHPHDYVERRARDVEKKLLEL